MKTKKLTASFWDNDLNNNTTSVYKSQKGRHEVFGVEFGVFLVGYWPINQMSLETFEWCMKIIL